MTVDVLSRRHAGENVIPLCCCCTPSLPAAALIPAAAAALIPPAALIPASPLSPDASAEGADVFGEPAAGMHCVGVGLARSRHPVVQGGT